MDPRFAARATKVSGRWLRWCGESSPFRHSLRKQGIQKGQKVMKQPAVYLLANQRNGTLYVGVTSDLVHRVWQHRTNEIEGFSKKYHVHLLVWFEQHPSMESAIIREKAIKKWKRAWKLDLIVKSNPEWQDLWPIINGWSLENQE